MLNFFIQIVGSKSSLYLKDCIWVCIKKRGGVRVKKKNRIFKLSIPFYFFTFNYDYNSFIFVLFIGKPIRVIILC